MNVTIVQNEINSNYKNSKDEAVASSYIAIHIIILLLLLTGFVNPLFSSTDIPANHPYIQYYGRWDFSDSLAPTHSWPAVYIYTEFEGTSIGIKTNDNASWYNVFIDGEFIKIFQGNKAGVNSYTLVSGLSDSTHTLLLTKRGETSWTKFSFNGFILDDGKTLLLPKEKPERKIEFIGDSYTCASGNEWTESSTPPNDSYTNIYTGFASIVARNFDAQYHISARSGFGMVTDWQGNYTNNVPDYFDRALFSSSLPKWDFQQWLPNLVVICLGLNDYNGFGGYSGGVTQDETNLFISRYHEFIGRIRDLYPGVKILAVAANGVSWIKSSVAKVVADENNDGKDDIFYTDFPLYEGGYINNGHPNVETHKKIADVLIAAIDTIDAWQSASDSIPPQITILPDSPFIVYDTSYVLKVQTDSYATLRYSIEDKSYEQMEFEFSSTGKRQHSTVISCEHNQHYTLYIRAIDKAGNQSTSSAIVEFSVDTTKELLDWKYSGYDNLQWKNGNAIFGTENISNAITKISAVTTAYFRTTINVEDIDKLLGFSFLIRGNDGAILYVNGNRIVSFNMNETSEISYSTPALSPMNINKSIIINTQNGLEKFRNGENVIAVEIHTATVSNPSLSFDAQFFDSNNKKYIALGSEWFYYDNGDIPPVQLKDKVTNVDEETYVPDRIILYDNYPNPFNPTTNITFYLDKRSHVELSVFDILGRQVEVIFNGEVDKGNFNFKFDAKNYSSGIYFYRLKTDSFSEIKKMVLTK